MRKLFLCVVCTSLSILSGITASAQNNSDYTVEVVARDLISPRGVAFTDEGSMLVVEAGSGFTEPGTNVGDGRILELTDLNGNGIYDDAGEINVLLEDQPSYNSLRLLNTYHDETYGIGDITVLPDGRIFYTRDNPYFEEGPAGTDAYYGDTGIFELVSTDTGMRFIQRASTVNALAYDAARQQFYAAESGRNQIITVPIDWEDDLTNNAVENPPVLAPMPLLDSNQQPVPSGIAIDPTTGDVLVALFSGFLLDYYGQRMSYMPGDARVVCVNVETGEVTDEITGLTTAIDVAVDASGNIFVAELTTEWSLAFTPLDYDLSDPDAGIDSGGYARYTGRISLYPADGSDPIILMDNVDTPTNLTYHEDALYISTGLGTPGRVVWTRYGERPIEGIIYRVSGF